jgi:hypothetical protein
MRLLTEIILAALIGLAWGKSFKDRLTEVPWFKDKITVSEKTTKTAPTTRPPPASSPSGAWMWDPYRRSVLDTPKPRSVTTLPSPSSTAGSWMFDPNHRSPLDPPSKGNRNRHRTNSGYS